MYGPDGLGKTDKGGHPRRRLNADARVQPDLANGAATDTRLDMSGKAGAGAAGAAFEGRAVADALEAESDGARGAIAGRSLGEDPRGAGARARRGGALLREVGAGLDRAAAGGSRGHLARARLEGEDQGNAAAGVAAAAADTAERTAATYAGGAAGGAEDSANCIRDYNPTTAAEYQEACSRRRVPPCLDVKAFTVFTSMHRADTADLFVSGNHCWIVSKRFTGDMLGQRSEG